MQTWDDIPDTLSLTDSRQRLLDRTETLRSTWLGTSAPTPAVIGQIWYDSDAAAGGPRLNFCTNATGPVFGEFFDTLMPDNVVTTARVANNAITDAKLRQGAALSVMGVTGNATANVADIAAGSDGYVLRRSGTALAFGQIALAAIPDDLITFAKLNSTVFDTDGTLAANSNTKLPTQSAVKAYVDASVRGLSWKVAVRAASTANGVLATAFENGDTMDGVTLATGDRILLKNQSTAAENGIYVVAASGAPTRATDADSGAEILQATVFVQEGTTLADTLWSCTTNAPITINSTSLTFAQTGGSAGGITALTGDVTASGSGSVAATIAVNVVGNTKIRQSSGLSVIGRSANSTGDVADITGTDGQVFRVSGTTLGFGTIATAGIADGAVTLVKHANMATSRVLGRITAGSGAPEELTAANLKTILALAQADISGLTTADSPQFAGINVGHASDTTLGRGAAGNLTIEGKSALRATSGTAANSGLVSWGTAAPGTLAEGEIYLRHA